MHDCNCRFRDTPCAGAVRGFIAWRGGKPAYCVCDAHMGEFAYWYRNAREVDESGNELAGGWRGMYADHCDARWPRGAVDAAG